MEGGNSTVPLQSNVEAKLSELLHGIISEEIGVVSPSTKEFAKLLKSESVGGELLKIFTERSPCLTELTSAWKFRDGNTVATLIIKLITVILNHPKGKYSLEEKALLQVSCVLDKFAKSILVDRMEAVYRELRSKDAKRQNAALMLMTSVVKRGAGMASEVEKIFNFKLPGLSALASGRKRKNQKRTTRKEFVRFAMSFLEEGKPWLIKRVLRHREMYSGVMRDLGEGEGEDEDEIIIHVLSTLRSKVLAGDSLVSPGLRSVLFGSATLEKLIKISGREEGGVATEIAHQVLRMVCTDPSNGLMPDMSKRPIPFKGNLTRVLGAMKKLKATEIRNHRSIILAIVEGRPQFASAYLEDFPYNLEDYGSSTWFGAMSLAADIICSVGKGNFLEFLASLSTDLPPYESSSVQDLLKCVSPLPLGRSVITKGLLHAEFLVKNASLRFLIEALKLAEVFLNELNSACNVERCKPLKKEFQNEVRILLPDSQVLLSLLSSVTSRKQSPTSHLKRKGLDGDERKKKIRIRANIEDSDIIVAGIDSYSSNLEHSIDDSFEEKENEVKEFANILIDIWGSRTISESQFSQTDFNFFFLSKLMDVLKIVLLVAPESLEGSFELIISQLTNGLLLPNYYQISVLSLLVRFVNWRPSSLTPSSTPPLLYKHLHSVLNLLMFSQIEKVKELAFRLARAAMFSSGAFDQNSHESVIWLLFIPGFYLPEFSNCGEEVDVVRWVSSAAVSFLSDALSTTGNNLFKYLDALEKHLSKTAEFQDLVPTFGPLGICVLQKCLRLLNSSSCALSYAEKSLIALYVSNSLKYMLQTQIEGTALAYVIDSVFSEISNDCNKAFDWSPIKDLLSFCKDIVHSMSSSIVFVESKVFPSDNIFKRVLDEVNRVLDGKDSNEFKEIRIAYSSAILSAKSEDLLQNFPSLLSLSSVLRVPIPLLSSLMFYERSFLKGILDWWPSIFWASMNMAISKSGAYCKDRLCSDDSSATTFFGQILEATPFHMAFPAILGLKFPQYSNFVMVQSFLLKKLSSSENKVNDMRLLLFWMNNLHSCFWSDQNAGVEQHAEICYSLVMHILNNVSFVMHRIKSCDDVMFSLAESIISHPLVSRVAVSTSFSSEDMESEFISRNLDDFTAFFSKNIHKTNSNVLNILKKACAIFCTLSNDDNYKPLSASVDNLLKGYLEAFKENVKKRNEAYSLVHSFYVIHYLAEFVSPFQLLELVHWLLHISPVDDSIEHEDHERVVTSIACSIFCDAVKVLCAYIQQSKCRTNMLWNLWRKEERNFDYRTVKEIFLQVCSLATKGNMNVAFLCFLNTIETVYVNIFINFCDLYPVGYPLLRVVASIPSTLLRSCTHDTNPFKAKLLYLLVKLSFNHLSVFGQLLYEVMSVGNALTENVFLIMPAALYFVRTMPTKLLENNSKQCSDVADSYLELIMNYIPNWKNLVDKEEFYESYDEIIPKNMEEISALLDRNILGKAIQLLQMQFATKKETTMHRFMEICASIHAAESVCASILECFEGGMDLYKQRNRFVGIVAKIKIYVIVIFAKDAGDCAEVERTTNRYKTKLRILKDLVKCWRSIVRKLLTIMNNTSNSGLSHLSSLYKSMEVFILTTILELITEMRNHLSDLSSISFFEKLFKFALLYRFEDQKTLKVLRKILTLFSGDNLSFASYLQLLLSHSRFSSTICIPPESLKFHASGFMPISSFLGSISFVKPHSSPLSDSDEVRLELVKILGLLYQLSGNCGDIVNLQELYLLLITSYGGTFGEVDVDMLDLIQKIESNDNVSSGLMKENDYLWGPAAFSARIDRTSTIDEFRKRVFRDNFPVDARICSTTVLHFPFKRFSFVEDSLNNDLTADDPINIQQVGEFDVVRYHPQTLLRFSLHALTRNYLEPVEFSSLGLLAIALMSMSSLELDIRKLGYEVIGKYKQFFEGIPKKKELMQLRLLLAHVQNGVEEPWQKLPSLIAIFAAEASVVLLDASHEHHSSLCKYFLHNSKMNVRSIPLFDTFFTSTAIGFKKERIWILRLIYAGLNLEDDAQIIVKNSTLPTLLSFYVSCLSDPESNDLILQILKKSVKLHKISRYLVEQCGIIPWVSSVITNFIASSVADQQICIHQLILLSEVVVGILSSRSINEWLRINALEQLMDLTLIFFNNFELLFHKADSFLINLVFQIIISSVKLSQKRRTYQPHLTLSFQCLLKIPLLFSQSNLNPEMGLKAILMTSPPLDFVETDREKMSSFLKWAFNAALQIDALKLTSEEELISEKLLRWIAASVILRKVSETFPIETRSNIKTLACFVGLFENEVSSEGNGYEKEMASFLLIIYQLLVLRNTALSSLISILCVVLRSFCKSSEKVKSLCSDIRPPAEANSMWRWSYFQPWRDLSSALTDHQISAEFDASQTLLSVFSNFVLSDI